MILRQSECVHNGTLRQRQAGGSGEQPAGEALWPPSSASPSPICISENQVAAGSSASATGDPNADGKGLSEGHSCPSYRAEGWLLCRTRGAAWPCVEQGGVTASLGMCDCIRRDVYSPLWKQTS